MYWVQGGHNPVIRRAGLDGSEPQTIVSTDVESVHSLSLGEMLLSSFENLSVDEEVAFYKLPNEFQKSDTVYNVLYRISPSCFAVSIELVPNAFWTDTITVNKNIEFVKRYGRMDNRDSL